MYELSSQLSLRSSTQAVSLIPRHAPAPERSAHGAGQASRLGRGKSRTCRANGAISGRTYLFVQVLAILIPLSAAAAPRPELRFLEQTDLPNSGIRFKLMQNAAEAPLPPPMTATYQLRSSSGGETTKDMYSPYELWIHDQHAGKWTDTFSNMVTLAVVRYPLPTGFRYAHAPREEYAVIAAKLLSEQKDWDMKDLNLWAASYLKEDGLTGTAITQKPFKFSQLVTFTLTYGQKHRFAYAFKLNNSATGQQLAPQTWFFVYIEANQSLDPQKVLQSVEKDFFGSIGVPPMSAERRVAASGSFQVGRKTDLSGKDDKSDEYKRSRDVVKQSITNLKDWWFVETKNFIILSNLKIRYRATLADLQTNIEHMRYAYELMLPPANPMTAVSVIRVPGTPAEYKEYVGEQYAWSGGLWMAARRELVVRAMDQGSSKQQSEQMLSTAYHEGFHQYLFYALGQSRAHAWFNEGHACFFETVTINNVRFAIGEHESMARDIDNVIKAGKLNIGELIKMDYKAFYADTDDKRKANYASAWLLIYYLRKHAEFDKTSPYANIASIYYAELMKTRDTSAANSKAFEGINADRLQEDIILFWNSRNMRVKARYNALFKDYKPGSPK